MDKNNLKIAVIGDVCIDWLQWPTKPKDEGLNWELYRGTRMVAKPGGALLLAEFMRMASDATVISPKLKNIEKISPEEVLHSNAELDIYPYSCGSKDKDKMVYRIKHCKGFSGPTTGHPKLLSLYNDNSDAEMVIIDDAGDGFRDHKENWPSAISAYGKRPIVVYKMSRPLAEGELWKYVCNNHAERLVVVVTADDLRASGLNISRCLSWERTAKDFVWHMNYFSKLKKCSNLVVRFGLEGAIHYKKTGDRVESRLYFFPAEIEDGFQEKYPGKMQGLFSAFVAALATKIAIQYAEIKPLTEAVGEGVIDGLFASRELFKCGFGSKVNQPDYPKIKFCNLFPEDEHDYIANVTIPETNSKEYSDPDFWCILNEKNVSTLEDIAKKIIKLGETAALKDIPVRHFGKLKTVDRAEIESLHSIKNLMNEYIKSENFLRPLSIAVFGSPGSGKSFGVTEVAESISQGKVMKLEFNASQFESSSDLISALHKVRDLALEGKIPLVFFDEFDSTFEGHELGWLKHFLAPMQDGKFMDQGVMHPIGKSIFVFAGGINSTFKEFSKEEDDKNTMQKFKDAKGPDFISRLRGYVNILGPNQINPNDTVFVIRRAMILRSLLERKAGHLFDNKRHARIDDGILHALINVPNYKHGTRSMEAIIEMSMLSDRKIWAQAYLPPKDQLKLHVDSDEFMRLLVSHTLKGNM